MKLRTATRLFIVGISIGGVEAPLVARAANVHGVVVINTVAKPFFEYLLDTRRRQMELRHLSYDEIDAAMQVEERCNHHYLIERQTMTGCRDQTTYPAPASYMQQWAAQNPSANWKTIDAPVLIVYGTSDYVATNADSPYLAKIINSFHPRQATVRAISGMDHNMLRAGSMEESMNRTDPGEFDVQIVDVIGAWLAAHS